MKPLVSGDYYFKKDSKFVFIASGYIKDGQHELMVVFPVITMAYVTEEAASKLIQCKFDSVTWERVYTDPDTGKEVREVIRGYDNADTAT